VSDDALFTGIQTGDSVDIFNTSNGNWTRSSLSQARQITAAVSVGSKAIFAGGFTGASTGKLNQESAQVDIFDSSSDSWSTRQLSQARSEITALSAESKAVFAGGLVTNDPNSRYTESNAVDIYDDATGRWSSAQLSQARASMAGAATTNLMFFAGGETFDRHQGLHDSALVDIYNSAENTWNTARLSVARHGIATAVVGSKVLFAGGETVAGGSTAAVDIYDTVTGRWSTAELSEPGAELSAFVLGNKAFFAGELSGIVDVYDAMTGIWSTISESQARNNLAVGSVGTMGFLAGGDDASGETSSLVDVFDDETPTVVPDGTVNGRASERASIVLQNSGDANFAGPYTVQVYAIPPGQYHGAVLVGSQVVNGALAAGDSLRFSIPIGNLANAPAGTYHLVAMVKAADGTLTPFAGATQDFTIKSSANAKPAAAKSAPAIVRPTFSTIPITTLSPDNAWLTDMADVLD
jgi:kelch-like protein 20